MFGLDRADKVLEWEVLPGFLDGRCSELEVGLVYSGLLG